jgi:tetratricopeptide (TPR) repeat protein
VKGRVPVRRAPLFVIMLAVGALAQAQDAVDLIRDADALYDRWDGAFDFDAYGTRLASAIELYEQALSVLPLESVQSRSIVLNRLSQASFELATAYLDDANAAESTFAKGKDYALASLRLDPQFVAEENDSFRAALGTARDIQAVFWYGNNLGSYLNYHQIEAIVFGGMRDVPVCFERAMTLDKNYLGGAPLRSLASYYARVPTFLGGDPEQARALYEQAIDVDPDFLENAVGLAEFVFLASKDTDTACTSLRDVLNAADDPAVVGVWPLYNALAVARAEALVADNRCP